MIGRDTSTASTTKTIIVTIGWALALTCLSSDLYAQDSNRILTITPETDSALVSTAVFSFILEQTGMDQPDPAETSGRHEILRLRAGDSPLRGEFSRVRLDRIGLEGWTSEGWYEIRGSSIQLYHSDNRGNATGRVEIGSYHVNTICLPDRSSGQVLAFRFLNPGNDSGLETVRNPVRDPIAPMRATSAQNDSAEIAPAEPCVTPLDSR